MFRSSAESGLMCAVSDFPASFSIAANISFHCVKIAPSMTSQTLS